MLGKNLVAMVSALGLTASLVLAAHAEPITPNNASQLCAANQDFGLGSHGGCVSVLQSGNITAAVAEICRLEFGPILVGAKNHGE